MLPTSRGRIKSTFAHSRTQVASGKYRTSRLPCCQITIEISLVVVGVNEFVAEQERSIPLLRVNEEIERSQVARLQTLRAKRDAAKAEAALAELARRAGTTENLLPAILNAVESYATVGEISDALRRVFGEYQESVVL